MTNLVLPEDALRILSAYEGTSGYDPDKKRYFPKQEKADRKGILTIGRGRVLLPHELKSGLIKIGGYQASLKDGLTEDQINTLFKQDIAGRLARVAELCPTNVPHEFGALFIQFYNYAKALAPGHSLGDAHRSGDKGDTVRAFMKYVYSGKPKVFRLGLWRRQGCIALYYRTGEVMIAKGKPHSEFSNDAAAEKALFQRLADWGYGDLKKPA